jgi:hypothetical protein
MHRNDILNDFEFRKSIRKLKKYDVFYNGEYITSFGGIRPNGVPHTQYYDKLRLYKDYDNLDEKKRANYKKRHEGDRHKKYSAGWFSDLVLW